MIATNYETLVLEVTQKLGEKLSTVAPHVWEVMVRQSVMWGWSCAACWSIAASLTALSIWWSWFKWKYDHDGDGDTEAAHFFCRMFTAIGGACLIFVLIIELPEVLTAIVNPEYRAMMNLIGK